MFYKILLKLYVLKNDVFPSIAKDNEYLDGQLVVDGSTLRILIMNGVEVMSMMFIGLFIFIDIFNMFTFYYVTKLQ